MTGENLAGPSSEVSPPSFLGRRFRLRSLMQIMMLAGL
jgi:hypothetical protein